MRPEDEERQAAEGSGESPQAEGTADAGDGQEGGSKEGGPGRFCSREHDLL